MLDQSQKSTSDLIQALSTSFTSALDRMATDDDEKQINGVSWQDHMRELRGAEERGYERHKDITEMIELKASEKSENGGGDESLTSTLIKSVLPTLMQVVESRFQAKHL